MICVGCFTCGAMRFASIAPYGREDCTSLRLVVPIVFSCTFQRATVRLP